MRIALLILLSITASAATRTVCASGCDRPDLMAAVSDSTDGDIIELKAGETFASLTRIRINLTIRSSRWRELPAIGQRIDPVAHAALLPTIEPLVNDSPIKIGTLRLYANQNGVNITTNTITFGGADTGSELYAGARVSCYAPPSLEGVMPGGMPIGEYYIESWNSGTREATFSVTRGTPIDLTTVGSAASATDRYRPQCALVTSPRVEFVGVRITSTATNPTNNALLTVGDNAQVAGGPTLIMRHCIVEGAASAVVVPEQGVVIIDGVGHVIRDSVIRRILGRGETKAIIVANAGQVLIQNNTLQAGGINILLGGLESPRQRPTWDVQILNNWISKPGDLHWRSGDGAPSGACYYGGGSGGKYRDLVAGTCYTCQSNETWASSEAGSTCASIRSQNKNLFEIKDGVGVIFLGNWLDGQQQTFDGGQGFAAGVSVGCNFGAGTEGFGGPYVRAHDILFTRNRIDSSFSGLIFGNSQYGGCVHAQVPIRNVVFRDNLSTNMARLAFCETKGTDGTAAITCDINNGINRFAIRSAGGMAGIIFDRYTARGGVGGGIRDGFSLTNGSYTPRSQQALFSNILGVLTDLGAGLYGTIQADTGSTDCVPTTGYAQYGGLVNSMAWSGNTPTPGGTLMNSATNCSTFATAYSYSQTDPLFVSAADSRLQSGSIHIASATDGGPLGADVDLIDQETIPARDGTPRAKEALALRLEANVGSVTAKFDSALSCTATVWTNRRRNTAAASQTGVSPLTVSATAGVRWVTVACGSRSWIEDVQVR